MTTQITFTIPAWLDKIFTWPVLEYRRRKYGSPFRKIPLGEGRFTIVDPPDFYRLNIYHWSADGQGDLIYAVRNVISPDKRTKIERMHRIICNAPADLLVDHINSNGLDNRRANLRLATHSQNQCNRRKRKSKTASRFVGLAFVKSRKQWSCRLNYQGKRIWLGYFDSEIEAAQAHDIAALKYHKEFARLNFPMEDYLNKAVEAQRRPTRRIFRSEAQKNVAGALKYHGEFAKLNFPKEIERSPKRLNLRLANWLGARLNFPEDAASPERPVVSKVEPGRRTRLNFPISSGERLGVFQPTTEMPLKYTKGNGKVRRRFWKGEKMKKTTTNIVCLTIIIGMLIGCAKEAEKPSAKKLKPAPATNYTADWNSLSQRNPAPDWFRNAKFGIYFHWGVYTVPAFGNEWYPRNMYDVKSPEYKHHVKTWGEPNVFGYPDFVPMFKAEKFDANEWADLFVKTGARFAGPVAEHHDGFSMWASKLTPWNAKDMGPHRDCVGELEKAIRGRGMRFVTTFHHERNGLYEITKDGKTYWTGHYEFVKKNFPELLEDPCRAIMYGYMPADKYFQMWEDKLLEVIDNYHPDLMYFDSWLDEIPDKYKMGYLAHYFNDAGKLGKEVVVTYKQQDLPKSVGIEDYEKGRADKLTDYVWLTDDTLSRGSWCYTEGLGIKRPVEIVRTMIDIVSKNGQLMLNISPKADGTIPDNQKQVLLAIGDWMGKYGEAIYETRPFVDYGEGPTKMQSGGMFARMQGGYIAKDIRYTRKGNTVYAMALGWPGEKTSVTMKIFGKGGKAGDIKVKKVTMLGTKEKIKWQRTDAGLVVTTPKKQVDSIAVVFKMEI